MIVSLICIIFLDTSWGWLYVFSVALAVEGYKYMKAPYGNKALIISMLCACIAFIIFLYVTSFYFVNRLADSNFYSIFEQFGVFEVINKLIFSSYYIELYGFETIFFIGGLIGISVYRPFSKRKLLKDQEKIERFTKSIQI